MINLHEDRAAVWKSGGERASGEKLANQRVAILRAVDLKYAGVNYM